MAIISPVWDSKTYFVNFYGYTTDKNISPYTTYTLVTALLVRAGHITTWKLYGKTNGI